MTLRRAFFIAVIFMLGVIAGTGTVCLLSGIGDQFAYDAENM